MCVTNEKTKCAQKMCVTNEKTRASRMNRHVRREWIDTCVTDKKTRASRMKKHTRAFARTPAALLPSTVSRMRWHVSHEWKDTYVTNENTHVGHEWVTGTWSSLYRLYHEWEDTHVMSEKTHKSRMRTHMRVTNESLALDHPTTDCMCVTWHIHTWDMTCS